MVTHDAGRRTGLIRIASTALAMLLAALPASAFARSPASPAVERRAFAERILASANAEWGRYFASRGRIYNAPRSLFMQLPDGHPARGFGYLRNLAVSVELNDMIELQRTQPASADFITALIIAHEVAHHVQRVIENAAKINPPASMKRELEADCAAGWWLGRANARHLEATGSLYLAAQDLAVELPRALDLLSRSTLGGRERASDTHGQAKERISAIELGMRSPRVENCGAGFRF